MTDALGWNVILLCSLLALILLFGVAFLAGDRMNPVLSQALGSILRHVLTLGAGYLISQGIWSKSESDVYVEAIVLGALGVGWSLWQKSNARKKLIAALEAPAGTPESHL